MMARFAPSKTLFEAAVALLDFSGRTSLRLPDGLVSKWMRERAQSDEGLHCRRGHPIMLHSGRVRIQRYPNGKVYMTRECWRCRGAYTRRAA